MLHLYRHRRKEFVGPFFAGSSASDYDSQPDSIRAGSCTSHADLAHHFSVLGLFAAWSTRVRYLTCFKRDVLRAQAIVLAKAFALWQSAAAKTASTVDDPPLQNFYSDGDRCEETRAVSLAKLDAHEPLVFDIFAGADTIEVSARRLEAQLARRFSCLGSSLAFIAFDVWRSCALDACKARIKTNANLSSSLRFISMWEQRFSDAVVRTAFMLWHAQQEYVSNTLTSHHPPTHEHEHTKDALVPLTQDAMATKPLQAIAHVCRCTGLITRAFGYWLVSTNTTSFHNRLALIHQIGRILACTFSHWLVCSRNSDAKPLPWPPPSAWMGADRSTSRLAVLPQTPPPTTSSDCWIPALDNGKLNVLETGSTYFSDRARAETLKPPEVTLTYFSDRARAGNIKRPEENCTYFSDIAQAVKLKRQR